MKTGKENPKNKQHEEPSRRVQILADPGYAVLDGALATELEARGADLNHPLWSAHVLVHHPELIEQVHYDYFCAGADIATTASYQATYPGLAAMGIDAETATSLLQTSVQLAQSARTRFWAQSDQRPGRSFPLVAASIGPYGAYLADGSEYRGNYGLTCEDLLEFHAPRLDALCAAQPDLLACETIPELTEARALVLSLATHAEQQGPPPPAWISFACNSTSTLNSGEDFASAVAEIAASPHVASIGVNCTAPQYITGLLQQARPVTEKPLLVYPNRGEAWDAVQRCWIPDPQAPALVDYVPEWMAAGATVIGGCCRVGPADIRQIAARLRQKSH